jgi:hypothetical protein
VTLSVSPEITAREPPLKFPVESSTEDAAAVSLLVVTPAAPMAQNAPVTVAEPLMVKATALEVALLPADAAENVGTPRVLLL